MTTVRLDDLYPTWTMVPNPNRAFGEPGMLLYNENGHLVKGVVDIGARDSFGRPRNLWGVAPEVVMGCACED